MTAETAQHGVRTYEVKAWEFNLLIVELVVFSGLVAGGLMALGRRLPWAGGVWPEAAWMGLGFLLIGLALYPVLSILSRNTHNRSLGFGRWLAWSLASTAVGSLLYGLIR